MRFEGEKCSSHSWVVGKRRRADLSSSAYKWWSREMEETFLT